jgi:hypothetical protein
MLFCYHIATIFHTLLMNSQIYNSICYISNNFHLIKCNERMLTVLIGMYWLKISTHKMKTKRGCVQSIVLCFPIKMSSTWRSYCHRINKYRVTDLSTFCTTTLVRKKRGKITSLPVTSLPVKCLTSLPDTCLPVALFPVAHWGWQTQWLSWETHTLATPL